MKQEKQATTTTEIHSSKSFFGKHWGVTGVVLVSKVIRKVLALDLVGGLKNYLYINELMKNLKVSFMFQ